MDIYKRLQTNLEANGLGKAVAIHVNSGDYAIGDTHARARRLLNERQPEGDIVTLTIGPPTAADYAVAYRIQAGQKI